jgi:polyhydroxyalkanoate synthesis regulator phasin
MLHTKYGLERKITESKIEVYSEEEKIWRSLAAMCESEAKTIKAMGNLTERVEQLEKQINTQSTGETSDGNVSTNTG